MTEKQQQHPDWCWWRPAAPGLILSPLPGARLSLASAKGHRYAVLCPCPAPAYLIGGQEWPRRACQEPLSVGPRHQTQGPTLAPLLFEALGRLIGLLCRAPLWGSAQACSSCWVCRRRKEQRLIPLQVSLSVATLHFQWLRKVTSALDKPAQEPPRNSADVGRHLETRTAAIFLFLCSSPRQEIAEFLEIVSINGAIPAQSSFLHTLTHWMILRATAEQSNAHPHNAVYQQFNLDYGLMVKWMTTNMQMYISYLHSRLQQGVLIIGKYVGHHGGRRASLRLCLSPTNSSPADFRRGAFSPHIFPRRPAANTENPSQEFPWMYFELFEFNTGRKCFLK